MSQIQNPYYESISILIITMSSLSFLGSLFVLIMYLSMRLQKNFAYKLITFLCLSDLVSSISCFIQVPLLFQKEEFQPKSFICDSQAYLRIFADLSSIIWSCIISFSIYISVIHNQQNIERRLWVFLCLAYLIPLGVSSYPIIANNITNRGYYCSLDDNHILELCLQYGPLWIAIFMIFYFNLSVLIKLSRERSIDEQDRKNFQRILIFPVILIVCGFLGTVQFIMNLIGVQMNDFWMLFLWQAFRNAQGFLNALFYGLSPMVRQRLKEIILGRSGGSHISVKKSLSSASYNGGSKSTQKIRNLREFLLDSGDLDESMAQQYESDYEKSIVIQQASIESKRSYDKVI